MNKRVKCVFALLTTTLLTACSFSRFDGSRTGNESQLIMEYEMLNMTDSQKLALSEGDIVDFDVVSLSGSVDIVLSEEEEEPIYSGADVPTSTFQVTIDKSGTYVVSVVGKKAKGSVKILKKSKDAEKENASLPDMQENDAESLTKEHCESITISDQEVISSEFDMFWTDKTIALKRGTNVFYISGDDISCKMHFEIPKIDKSKISHVGIYTKEEAQEKVRGKNNLN